MKRCRVVPNVYFSIALVPIVNARLARLTARLALTFFALRIVQLPIVSLPVSFDRRVLLFGLVLVLLVETRLVAIADRDPFRRVTPLVVWFTLA